MFTPQPVTCSVTSATIQALTDADSHRLHGCCCRPRPGNSLWEPPGDRRPPRHLEGAEPGTEGSWAVWLRARACHHRWGHGATIWPTRAALPAGRKMPRAPLLQVQARTGDTWGQKKQDLGVALVQEPASPAARPPSSATCRRGTKPGSRAVLVRSPPGGGEGLAGLGPTSPPRGRDAELIAVLRGNPALPEPEEEAAPRGAVRSLPTPPFGEGHRTGAAFSGHRPVPRGRWPGAPHPHPTWAPPTRGWGLCHPPIWVGWSRTTSFKAAGRGGACL